MKKRAKNGETENEFRSKESETREEKHIYEKKDIPVGTILYEIDLQQE